MDGIAGARVDLAAAPSVDIANGAPTGAGATNEIVVAWADGGTSLNNERVMFRYSSDGGDSWAAAQAISLPGDRGLYAAPAISPNGADVYVVYNAYTTPFRQDTVAPRGLVNRPARECRLERRTVSVDDVASRRARRSARVESEQPAGGVPWGLRLRDSDTNLRRRRLE
jgi:hypothetical protein